MQVETLDDVLKWTSDYHQSLADRLDHSSGNNESERARLLLDYLSKHEASLARTVHESERTAEGKSLNTWCYEYLEKHQLVQRIHFDESFSNLNSAQIMDIVTDQHNQIIELYRYLYSRANIPETKTLLGALLELEQHEAMQMMQGANRLQDI